MKIGVFDSGKGGEFIAEGLKMLLPEHDYIVMNDRNNVPYGSRTNDEVIVLTDRAIQPLISAGCPIIVITCNTATMAAISTLRTLYPSIAFVGIEPMIKPAAALSKTRRCTVLATPLTLKSERYRILTACFGAKLVIDEPNAAGWAAAIESGTASMIDYSEVALSVKSGSDTIILACTHYITLKKTLKDQFPRVNILEPTEAIASRIRTLVTTT